MSKYLPLSDRLARETADQWRPTLAEIEEVLGFPLPKAAQQAAWWGGAAEKPHHRAWLDHGWRAGDLDRASGTVTFHRDTAPHEVQPEALKAASEAATKTVHTQRAMGAAALIGAGVAVAAGVGVLAAKLLKGRRA